MRAYVAITDWDWFRHLRSLDGVDEVNFWTPKPWRGRFGVLSRGQPLLFKLRSPRKVIVGGGFFEHYTKLPISVAWQAFGEKNGAATLDELRARTARLRHDEPRPWEDYTIGCILLAEPFFWDEEDWFAQPPDWSPNTQRGAGYDLTSGVGKELWDQVAARLQAGSVAEPRPEQLDLPGGYSDPVPTRHRVGQGIFRSVVTDVYGRQCAVTRERALPALDAAHIRPFSVTPENYVQNGLLLRSDVHRLFDAGYVTVTPSYEVEVSAHIRDDFDDGKNYLRLHGRRLWVPEQAEYRPAAEHLEWHNENRFRA